MGDFEPKLKHERDQLLRQRAQIDRRLEKIAELLQEYKSQPELRLVSPMSVAHAVREACKKMKDGITRQRVIAFLREAHPTEDFKDASVATAILNLTRGDEPALFLARKGEGRQAAVYSTETDQLFKLSEKQWDVLFSPEVTHGTGGWQSMFKALQKSTRGERGGASIIVSPELRARIQHYINRYGTGGWQSKLKAVLGEHLPHLFRN